MAWLLILLILLLLLSLVGGGGYVYRNYYGPAGMSTVESGPAGSPVGAVVALIVIIFILLFLIYGGFNIFGWFGSHTTNINVTTTS